MCETCVFCKIKNGEIKTKKLFETKDTFVLADINPLSLGHLLIIPKKHSIYLHELDEHEIASLSLVLKKSALALKKWHEEKNKTPFQYNVLQNNGELAGQEVKHVHFHIIPKEKHYGLGLEWIPQEYSEKEKSHLENLFE